MLNKSGNIILSVVSSLFLCLSLQPFAEAKVIYAGKASEVRKVTPSPGDTVIFRNGRYTDASLLALFSGTPEARTTFMAETPGGVVLEGKSSIRIKGSHLNVEGFVIHNPSLEVTYPILVDVGTTDVHIRECCVWGDDEVGIETKQRTKWACFYGTCHEMERCSFDGKRNLGVMVDVCFEPDGKSPSTEVHNCYFSRPYSIIKGKSQRNGQESFRFGSSTYSKHDAKGVCRDNWFYRCNGEIEIISSKSSGNLYENNLFENCEGELTLRHGDDNVVRRNIFLSDGNRRSGGVRIIGRGHLVEDNYMQGLGGQKSYSAICVVGANPSPELYEYWPADDCVVRGNTIVDCRSGIYVNLENHVGGPVAPKNLRVEKNVLSVGPKAESIVVNKMDPSQIRWKKNVINGGKQQGTSLKETVKTPAIPDVSARAEEIRRNAGVSYKYN